MHLQLQLEPQRLQRPLVDRENGVIHDVVAMAEGEARGHDVWADRKTLLMLAAMGQEAKDGIRGRFGHPGMSENATGKQIQRAKNFRVQDNKLVHEFHAFEAARKSPSFSQDPIEYIFDVAERTPEDLGESVVITTDLFWTFGDGSERHVDEDFERDGNGRPLGSKTPFPVMRPEKFHFVDIVSEGALTPDGMFSIFSNSGDFNQYAAEAFQFVDRWREQYGISLEELPEKINQLLLKYENSRRSNSMARRRKFEAEDIPQLEDQDDALLEDEIVEESPEATVDGSDNDESNEQPEEAPTADDDGDQELDEAEAILEEMSKATEQKDTSASLIAQVAELNEAFAKLSMRMQRMSKILNQNLTQTLALQKEVSKLSGEPFQNATLPDVSNGNFQQLQFAAKPKAAPKPPRQMTAAEKALQTQVERYNKVNLREGK